LNRAALSPFFTGLNLLTRERVTESLLPSNPLKKQSKMSSKMPKNAFAALDDSDEEYPRVSAPAPLADVTYNYRDNWVLWADCDSDAPPCRCCSVGDAVGEMAWSCSHSGRRWLILDAPPDLAGEHPAEVCLGNCRLHPLLTHDVAEIYRAMAAGVSWGDVMLQEEAAADALLSPEELAAKRAYEAECRAREDARRKLELEASERRLKAERVAVRTGAACGKKAVVKKVAQPCKFLYNCQGSPAKPTTKTVTTECWSHEYVDPATGRRVVKHACDRLHPGEEGWLPQWNGNPSYRAPAPAGGAGAAVPNRFQSMGGAGRSGHRHGPQCAGGCGGR
jgi:hypothetical protein